MSAVWQSSSRDPVIDTFRAHRKDQGCLRLKQRGAECCRDFYGRQEDTSFPDLTENTRSQISQFPGTGWNQRSFPIESCRKSRVRPAWSPLHPCRLSHIIATNADENWRRGVLAYELPCTESLTCKSWPALQDSISGAPWLPRPLFLLCTTILFILRYSSVIIQVIKSAMA